MFFKMSSEITTITVPVPMEHMGRIIGPGGENIKKIQNDTRTRITKYKKEGECGFHVTGVPSGCKNAQQAIIHCFVSRFSK